MPDPVDLPTELLDLIFPIALRNESLSTYDCCELDLNHGADTRQLSRLLLVGRKWHTALVPHLYPKWTYNGARLSFASLWKFLRTVLTNPPPPAGGHSLHAAHRQLGVFYPEGLGSDHAAAQDNLAFSHEDVGLYRTALHGAGLESRVLDAQPLIDCDRRLLVALLLASLPGVSTLYAHVPYTDPLSWCTSTGIAGISVERSPWCVPDIAPPCENQEGVSVHGFRCRSAYPITSSLEEFLV